MKITAIKTAPIQGNYVWNLVKIETDEGLSGIGEAYWGHGVEKIILDMAPLLIGENPFNIEYLFNKLMRMMSGQGSMAGTVVTAISGIELALWDLLGKSLNVPVYRLLGGRFRDRIKLYADCGQGEQPNAKSWTQRVKKALSNGFQAVKLDIDNIGVKYSVQQKERGDIPWTTAHRSRISNKELSLIVDLIGAVRNEIGPDIDLAVDCHWNYAVSDAIRLIEVLEPFQLMWIEDPVPPENTEAMGKVSRSSSVPICTGENLYTCYGFRDLIVNQGSHIVQPDIPKVGGLMEAKRIAHLADLYYMHIAIHNVSSPIATMAAAHVCATMRNFLIMEYHSLDVPWWEDLADYDEPIIKNGFIKVPEGAGFGIKLNESVARKHLAGGGSYFQETYYSQ